MQRGHTLAVNRDSFLTRIKDINIRQPSLPIESYRIISKIFADSEKRKKLCTRNVMHRKRGGGV